MTGVGGQVSVEVPKPITFRGRVRVWSVDTSEVSAGVESC